MKLHYSNFYLGVIHAPMYTISNFSFVSTYERCLLTHYYHKLISFFQSIFFSSIFLLSWRKKGWLSPPLISMVMLFTNEIGLTSTRNAEKHSTPPRVFEYTLGGLLTNIIFSYSQIKLSNSLRVIIFIP